MIRKTNNKNDLYNNVLKKKKHKYEFYIYGLFKIDKTINTICKSSINKSIYTCASIPSLWKKKKKRPSCGKKRRDNF